MVLVYLHLYNWDINGSYGKIKYMGSVLPTVEWIHVLKSDHQRDTIQGWASLVLHYSKMCSVELVSGG